MSFVGTFEYAYPDGLVIRVVVADEKHLDWEGIEGPAKGQRGREECDRREVAPGVHFISWLEKDGTAISQVVDLNRGTVLCNVTAGGQRCFMEGTVRRTR
jgi:hypothetical protein